MYGLFFGGVCLFVWLFVFCVMEWVKKKVLVCGRMVKWRSLGREIYGDEGMLYIV